MGLVCYSICPFIHPSLFPSIQWIVTVLSHPTVSASDNKWIVIKVETEVSTDNGSIALHERATVILPEWGQGMLLGLCDKIQFGVFKICSRSCWTKVLPDFSPCNWSQNSHFLAAGCNLALRIHSTVCGLNPAVLIGYKIEPYPFGPLFWLLVLTL